MLVHVPADRSRVVAVSFPRDLDVERPVCQAWDNDTGTYTDETYPAADGDKLNATYALGGPKCLVKVIQKMSGLQIKHFVGMDFAGFESMVDTVGGVNVCIPQPLIDGELGNVLPVAGNQTLDGRKALDYVRARHVEAEGNGDYGRIKRQQLFLSALLREAMSSKVLFDPGKLNGFINAFTRATFVEGVDTRSLLTLGQSLRNVDAGAVTFITVPTAGTNDWGNEIPRLDDIKAIFQAIIDDQPLPGEERTSGDKKETTPAPAPDITELASAPEELSVQVSNGSGSPAWPPARPIGSPPTASASTASATTARPAARRSCASPPASRPRPRLSRRRYRAPCSSRRRGWAASSRWCSAPSSTARSPHRPHPARPSTPVRRASPSRRTPNCPPTWPSRTPPTTPAPEPGTVPVIHPPFTRPW